MDYIIIKLVARMSNETMLIISDNEWKPFFSPPLQIIKNSTLYEYEKDSLDSTKLFDIRHTGIWFFFINNRLNAVDLSEVRGILLLIKISVCANEHHVMIGHHLTIEGRRGWSEAARARK